MDDSKEQKKDKSRSSEKDDKKKGVQSMELTRKSTIEYSLCGSAVFLGDARDKETIFEAHKIDTQKFGVDGYVDDPNFIVRCNSNYYDAKAAEDIGILNVYNYSMFEEIDNDVRVFIIIV